MLRFLSLLLMSSFFLQACSGSSSPNPTAVIETSLGNFTIEIFQNEVPEMAKNFIELVKQGKYENVPFHRVIQDFMIQTGDFENKDGTGGYSYKGPGTQIDGQYASGLSNDRGTLAWANSGPDTNGSQFFINVKDNPYLDHDKEPRSSAHPVFAIVIEGMDIVDKISNVATDPNDRPLDDVLISKILISQ